MIYYKCCLCHSFAHSCVFSPPLSAFLISLSPTKHRCVRFFSLSHSLILLCVCLPFVFCFHGRGFDELWNKYNNNIILNKSGFDISKYQHLKRLKQNYIEPHRAFIFGFFVRLVKKRMSAEIRVLF